MTTEAATPPVDTSTPASAQTQQVANNELAPDAIAPEVIEPKAPKTLEQLQAELDAANRDKKRMQRGINRRTAALAEERARNQLTPKQHSDDNRADDGETVSLTKAELQRQIRDEAQRLAPTLSHQAAEVERRQGVIDSLTKTLGSQKFDQLASDLDEAFGGLQDRSGSPKAALEAVFEADNPAQVIEYLADPEHADEADAISRMGPVQAGKAVARLEDRLKAEKTKAAPQASSAPAPLERLRGVSPANKALADLDGEAFAKRRREQIKNRM